LAPQAERAGATVIAAARGEKKLAVAKHLVAGVVIDHSAPGGHEDVRDAAGGGVQVIPETTVASASEAAFGLLTPGTGRIVIHGTASGQAPQFHPLEVLRRGMSVTGFTPAVLPPEHLTRLRGRAFELATTGEPEPVTGTAGPLADAATAHRTFQERAVTGKTILTPWLTRRGSTTWWRQQQAAHR
jgi:NADPH2:quinone reductase